MSANARAPTDPFLSLPLTGVRAIEASAGTGKTFTLATLVVRLVVERGLRIGQVLAVTFTEAATQELRTRIRARLQLAVALLDAPDGAPASAEARLTRAVLDAHLAKGGEPRDALRRRLAAAVHEIDLAAIFTIHGFCARVLREHALEAGHGFDAPELMANDGELRAAIAADLWRAHGVQDDAADDLLALWKGGHEALASDLSPLVREPVLRPALADLPDYPAPRLHAASRALADAVRAHGDTFRAALLDAVETKVLHGGSYKPEWIAALFDAIGHWCSAGDAGAAFDHPKLPQLTRDTLVLRTSKAGAGRTPESPICDAVPEYLAALAAMAEWQDARRVALLHRLRDDARGRIARFKQQRRVQTYDDMIDRVADALDGAHGDALVQRLRAQYAVALVDEFQDTDPRQWRIFERVFVDGPDAPSTRSRRPSERRGPAPSAPTDHYDVSSEGTGPLPAQGRRSGHPLHAGPAPFPCSDTHPTRDDAIASATSPRSRRPSERWGPAPSAPTDHYDVSSEGTGPLPAQGRRSGEASHADATLPARDARLEASQFADTDIADNAPFLALIGDPKQAIYGFRGGDVETYLAARAVAEDAPPLASNFRSRPGVLRAIAALYARADASGIAPFVDPRIGFIEVHAGGARDDADYLRDGQPAPALTLWQAPTPATDAKGKAKPYGAARSRELATAACVAAIHGVLADARAGRATLAHDGGTRAVQPGDIAVLVRSHAEATRIRQALALAGIPAVAAGKQSVWATDEARELHTLLLALLHGADDGRLRAALATVLVGVDARQLAALQADGDALQAWQLAALAWRERLRRGGPVALVNALCAEHAGRLLGLVDGERRLTNYLQAAELLQDAQARRAGLHGLVDWLARAIADASADDDSQLLRLESDARCVQVVTLHKSKGLEYPLVFLPYAAIGGKARDAGRHVTVAGESGRALHWKLLPTASGWDDAKQRWTTAQRAEDARLLYVGLTRARDALWIATGAFYNHDRAACAAMLAQPHALADALGPALHIDTRVPPATLPWLPPADVDAVPAARTATRVLASDWWVHSFTQLAHADGQVDASSAATQPAPGGRDEATSDVEAVDAGDAIDADPVDPRFGGTRFGVVLHDVLEHADFAAWRGWRDGDDAPGDARDRIAAALRRGGYASADVDDGIAALVSLAGRTLTAALPEGVRLADLAQGERRAEIEFQFALAPTRVDALVALLHRHGVVRGRHGFGMRRKLEGLMTGLIDLTYRHEGRWYVLDYKSNRLPGYGPAQLDAAMAHSEYDLQALLYTLALHRWLRFRLGDAYDYARDVGGVRYVFCRGLRGADPVRGMHAFKFDAALVHEVDALFGGGQA